MPNPYPVALRERAGRAYEDSTGTYQVVATRFAISVNALVRWVPDAKTVVSAFDLKAPDGRVYRVRRTTQRDEYEEPRKNRGPGVK